MIKDSKPRCGYSYADKRCGQHKDCPLCGQCAEHCPQHMQMATGIECRRPRMYYVDPVLSAFLSTKDAA